MAGRPWTTDEDNLLRKLVTKRTQSYEQMVPQFNGRTSTSLRRHAIDSLGINQKGRIHRRHSYNQAFFSVPNPINSYVAGYWAADGHVTDSWCTKVVAIELSHLEWHQLETFKQLMEYSGDVRDSSYSYREQMCALRFYGAYQLAADLETHFGVGPRKSHRLPAPRLDSPHLQLCYLAGLLDGDGSVVISNTNQLCVSYTSASNAIVEWVKTFTNSLGLRSIARNHKEPSVCRLSHAEAWTYRLYGLKAIDLIRRVQALKAEGIPILDRKWDNPLLNSYIRDYLAKHDISDLQPISASESGVYPRTASLAA